MANNERTEQGRNVSRSSASRARTSFRLASDNSRVRSAAVALRSAWRKTSVPPRLRLDALLVTAEEYEDAAGRRQREKEGEGFGAYKERQELEDRRVTPPGPKQPKQQKWKVLRFMKNHLYQKF